MSRWSPRSLDALLRKVDDKCKRGLLSAFWAEELRACRQERTPVKKKRAEPRRGRVKDPRFLSWMSKQPCLVTGELPATTHHIRSFGSPKDDRRTIRLVGRLHMLTQEKPGTPCIERIGKQAFEKTYGINIEAAIKDYNERYEKEQAS